MLITNVLRALASRHAAGPGLRKGRAVAWAGVAVLVLLTGCRAGPGAGRPQAAPPGPSASPGYAPVFGFDSDTRLPPGSETFAGTWQVRAEPGAPSAPNALCQTGTAPFPAIAVGRENYRDLVVSARVKPISGGEDRAGGLIARARDAANYYIVRVNALENNIGLYRYVNGKRETLRRVDITVESGVWHELRLDVIGDTLTGYFNGTRVITASDATFVAGRVGMWTKADSTTCFDDFAATAK